MLAAVLAIILTPACPVDGVVTSVYGRRVHPVTGKLAMHQGIDIGASAGTPFRSALDGVVEHAGTSPTWGTNVVVRSGVLQLRYAHASRISVHVGDVVRRGTHLGDVGSTGRATGPHLHLEVIRGVRRIDPTYMISTCVP